jgi:hypothetical protein
MGNALSDISTTSFLVASALSNGEQSQGKDRVSIHALYPSK